MISLGVFPSLLTDLVLGALGITMVCLILLWMLRQQKFLHRLSLSLCDLEQRNREAQRDLFLILRSHLALRDIPPRDPWDGANDESRLVSRDEESETNGQTGGLSLDEVRLLVALFGGEQSDRKSITGSLKGVKGFNNLDAILPSLRAKGFIFYSDVGDVVAIQPKGMHYLGLL